MEPRDADGADGAAGPSGLSGGAEPAAAFPASRALSGRAGSLTASAPHGRLASLRTRDLTLGGAFKKPKKTFEPNVHAVRKSKEELKEEVRSTPKRERRDKEERRREIRGRRREKPQTIQSHSIFEQGPADTLRKTGWYGAVGVCDSTASPVSRPVKKEKVEAEEDEDELLRKLQRDDFIEDPGLRNDDKLRPIQLPLCQSANFPTTAPDKAPLFRPPSSAAKERWDLSGTETPQAEPPTLVERLRDLSVSGSEELFFMQLPDSMPGRASAPKASAALQQSAEKVATKEHKPADRKPVHLKAQAAASKEGSAVLSEFPEGFLGKLQIRKSGKVELKLGDIVMDVTEGAAFSFLQQLVSVHLSEGQAGDMMVLGNVQHKLVLSPDFQALLQQVPTQQQQQQQGS